MGGDGIVIEPSGPLFEYIWENESDGRHKRLMKALSTPWAQRENLPLEQIDDDDPFSLLKVDRGQFRILPLPEKKPLDFSVLAGKPPGPKGFSGLYPGMVRTVKGDLIRETHETEKIPILVAVLCMDGGKFFKSVEEGRFPKSAYSEQWKESLDRWSDFGTIVAVSIHLVSMNGEWMLWPINDDDLTYGTQEWYETYIRGDFARFKEYKVGAIFCEGQFAYHPSRLLKNANTHFKKGYFSAGEAKVDPDGRPKRHALGLPVRLRDEGTKLKGKAPKGIPAMESEEEVEEDEEEEQEEVGDYDSSEEEPGNNKDPSFNLAGCDGDEDEDDSDDDSSSGMKGRVVRTSQYQKMEMKSRKRRLEFVPKTIGGPTKHGRMESPSEPRLPRSAVHLAKTSDDLVRKKIATSENRGGNSKQDSDGEGSVGGGGRASTVGGRSIADAGTGRGEGDEGATERTRPIVQGTAAGGRQYILTEEQYERLMMTMTNRPRSLSSEITSFVASSSIVGLSSPSPTLSGRSRLSSLTGGDCSSLNTGTGRAAGNPIPSPPSQADSEDAGPPFRSPSTSADRRSATLDSGVDGGGDAGGGESLEEEGLFERNDGDEDSAPFLADEEQELVRQSTPVEQLIFKKMELLFKNQMEMKVLLKHQSVGVSSTLANVRGPKDMGLKIPMLTRKDFVENFLKLNRNGVLRADLLIWINAKFKDSYSRKKDHAQPPSKPRQLLKFLFDQRLSLQIYCFNDKTSRGAELWGNVRRRNQAQLGTDIPGADEDVDEDGEYPTSSPIVSRRRPRSRGMNRGGRGDSRGAASTAAAAAAAAAAAVSQVLASTPADLRANPEYRLEHDLDQETKRSFKLEEWALGKAHKRIPLHLVEAFMEIGENFHFSEVMNRDGSVSVPDRNERTISTFKSKLNEALRNIRFQERNKRNTTRINLHQIAVRPKYNEEDHLVAPEETEEELKEWYRVYGKNGWIAFDDEGDEDA